MFTLWFHSLNRIWKRKTQNLLSVWCRCPLSASGLHSSLNFDGVRQQARKSILQRRGRERDPLCYSTELPFFCFLSPAPLKWSVMDGSDITWAHCLQKYNTTLKTIALWFQSLWSLVRRAWMQWQQSQGQCNVKDDCKNDKKINK